ncbi:hypothetical protein PPTG_20775 [Phytophthora nicotianae INRA-310]|uniref:Uncharacterized protein n=1 Tax=Phytophthora nicotianae (strain INRA-310) TaxID=761204 RepID=W2RFU8_PHYN3|nr:hypothetical protein PPTG_20775 [Phytophthora nicotianae INRA-310]ETN24283.1 hypothetical protein PPTG_20775 [Phytophthora nicotianae INRA-310]
MDNNIDFKLVHDYIKPGYSRKKGKRGVDYFNEESELLAYIRSDSDLCSRVFPEEPMASVPAESRSK